MISSKRPLIDWNLPYKFPARYGIGHTYAGVLRGFSREGATVYRSFRCKSSVSSTFSW